jgi:ligand-binding sensor domain-containing protein
MLDRANNVWFILDEPFVWRHPAGESVAEIVSKASRSDSEVYDMSAERSARFVDREGSVWVGADISVHRFSYSPLIEQELPKGPRPFFTLAPDDGGVVWISAGDGNGSSAFYRVADGKVEVQKARGGAANFTYRAADKSLWLGGEGGLWHMVNGSFAKIELPPEMAGMAVALTAISQDGSGGMWVSFGPVGLYRLKDGVWTKSGGRGDSLYDSQASSTAKGERIRRAEAEASNNLAALVGLQHVSAYMVSSVSGVDSFIPLGFCKCGTNRTQD